MAKCYEEQYYPVFCKCSVERESVAYEGKHSLFSQEYQDWGIVNHWIHQITCFPGFVRDPKRVKRTSEGSFLDTSITLQCTELYISDAKTGLCRA